MEDHGVHTDTVLHTWHTVKSPLVAVPVPVLFGTSGIEVGAKTLTETVAGGAGCAKLSTRLCWSVVGRLSTFMTQSDRGKRALYGLLVTTGSNYLVGWLVGFSWKIGALHVVNIFYSKKTISSDIRYHKSLSIADHRCHESLSAI